MTEKEKQEMIFMMIREMSRREKEGKVERFRELNRKARKGQIVFAGSSLMEQFPVYEMLLGRELPYTIYNRGVGGFTTWELLENLEPCILDLEPGALFLNIGTNDMNGEDFVLSEFMDRYETILRSILERLPDIKIFLLAFYPSKLEAAPAPRTRAAFACRTNERIRQANEAVRKLSEKLHAAFLDLNGPLTDQEGNLKKELTIDGVHMHVEGYELVVDQLVKVLERLSEL